jgi:hypothetical protein
MNGNIKKLSKQEERENEAERLKRKFNFYLSNGSRNSSIKSSNRSSNSNNIKTIGNYQKMAVKINSSNQKINPPKQEMKNKKTSTNIPVNINNVVNIVNNNYTNIITPAIINANISDTKSSSQTSSNDDTQRGNIRFETPFAVESCLKESSQRSTHSYKDFMIQNNLESNKFIKSSHLITNSDNIPSEADVVYNRSDYDDKIKVKGFKNYVKQPTRSDDDQVSANERTSFIHEEDYIDKNIYNQKSNIFINNPAYILSNRLINDECRHHHTLYKKTDYKFIQKIREDKLKFQTFSLKSFLKLSDYSMFTILSFIYNHYDELIKSHKILAKKIYLSLNNIFIHIINTFKSKFSDILELQEFYFKHIPFKKGKSQSILYLLYI